jgi:hypothetical protein
MVKQSRDKERNLHLPEEVYQIWSGFPKFRTGYQTHPHSFGRTLSIKGQTAAGSQVARYQTAITR